MITEIFLTIWPNLEVYQDIVGLTDIVQLRVKLPTDVDLVVDDETVLAVTSLVSSPQLEVQDPEQERLVRGQTDLPGTASRH